MSDKPTAIFSVLPAHEPSKMEIHAKKVLADMREISAACNAAGHRWALWELLSDLTALAGDIERETDGKGAVSERKKRTARCANTEQPKAEHV